MTSTETIAPAAKITYRKTKAGEWVAFGPAAELQGYLEGRGNILVSRKDGTCQPEIVERVGRAFEVAGQQMCYGYLARRDPGTLAVPSIGHGTCAECQRRPGVVQAPDSSGIVDMVCRRCASMSSVERSYA